MVHLDERKDLALGWHSTLSRPFGYAMISRALVLSLMDAGVDVGYSYLYGPGTVFPVEEGRDLGDSRLDVLKQSTPGDDAPRVIFGQGDAFEYVKREAPGRPYRIGYTMLEVSGLPDDWVRQANGTDEVWTPSPFNDWTFKKSGAERPVCVMPLGVDTSLFNTRVKGYPLKSEFTFLTVFEWGERKAPELLLPAFNRAFRRDEPVVLLCKYDNYDGDVDVVHQVGNMGLDPAGGRIVFMANRHVPYGELAMLYRSADCFVLPTRGEGWGMPILEAMACGLPVIATYWSAQQSFLTDANSYPLQVGRLVDAEAKCPYYEGFKWADPDPEHLELSMRHVFENQEEAAKKGRRAAADVAAKWSLERSRNHIVARLGEIAEERAAGLAPSFTTWLPPGQYRPKVGFDISRGVGGDVSGVGRSAQALAAGLAALAPERNPLEYLLLPGFGSFLHPLYRPGYGANQADDERFTVYRGPLPAFGDPDSHVPGLDLVHSTAYAAPDTGGVPLLVTVHDLTYVTHPAYHTAENIEYCESNVRTAIEAGASFIAVSENTRRDMIEHYLLAPERVFVVYNAVEPLFSPASEVAVASLVDEYGLPERFFLSVGTMEPRKNLETVIEAMHIYRGGEKLVIAGLSGWKNEELARTIDAMGDRVMVLGYLPQEALPALYSAALATVYPSLYEGFGLPILESMACGTPVITSDNSSIPEVAGDACILLADPTDAASLAAAMEALASDTEERVRLSNAGLRRAELFSPDAAAESAVAVYCSMIGIEAPPAGGDRG